MFWKPTERLEALETRARRAEDRVAEATKRIDRLERAITAAFGGIAGSYGEIGQLIRETEASESFLREGRVDSIKSDQRHQSFNFASAQGQSQTPFTGTRAP